MIQSLSQPKQRGQKKKQPKMQRMTLMARLEKAQSQMTMMFQKRWKVPNWKLTLTAMTTR